MQLHLDRRDRRPLYLQVVEQIKDLIRNGVLPAGSRLPSIRELAADTGLTRLTVHNAYAELQADGWIEMQLGDLLRLGRSDFFNVHTARG